MGTGHFGSPLTPAWRCSCCWTWDCSIVRATQFPLREAALESAVWVALSVGFGLWILAAHGRGPGLEFFTAYVIEKSLSVDNVFVFILIFQYFRVDARYQHRCCSGGFWVRSSCARNDLAWAPF